MAQRLSTQQKVTAAAVAGLAVGGAVAAVVRARRQAEWNKEVEESVSAVEWMQRLAASEGGEPEPYDEARMSRPSERYLSHYKASLELVGSKGQVEYKSQLEREDLFKDTPHGYMPLDVPTCFLALEKAVGTAGARKDLMGYLHRKQVDFLPDTHTIKIQPSLP